MNFSSSRSIRPLLLMAAGLLLIFGALTFYLLKPPGTAAAPTATTAQSGEAGLQGIPRVGLGDAKAAYDLKTAVFIDTRGHEYYKEGHIPGALSIPMDELVQRLGELNKEDWIIPYCT